MEYIDNDIFYPTNWLTIIVKPKSDMIFINGKKMKQGKVEF